MCVIREICWWLNVGDSSQESAPDKNSVGDSSRNGLKAVPILSRQQISLSGSSGVEHQTENLSVEGASPSPTTTLSCPVVPIELMKTKYTIELDGNEWCATNSDFIDLVVSIAGFGKTPLLALKDLLDTEKNLTPEGG